MSQNLKISIALGVAVVLAVVIAVVALGGSDDPAPAPTTADVPAEEVEVVRDDTHFLNQADGDVTLVEFLDFECEACGALFPAMEELRLEYSNDVSFAIRYFPLPSHLNAELSAQAAEAAANQDQFEAMYVRLFQTQAEWGESSESQEDFFLDLADELGLDMDQFTEDLHAEETIERVLSDKADGEQLGVQSTPTLFLNGQQMVYESFDDLKSQIDAAIAEQQ